MLGHIFFLAKTFGCFDSEKLELLQLSDRCPICLTDTWPSYLLCVCCVYCDLISGLNEDQARSLGLQAITVQFFKVAHFAVVFNTPCSHHNGAIYHSGR